MANLLDQLKSFTTVVSDSGDINSIKAYKPTDATTNPSLIATAAGMPEYQSIVDDVLQAAREKNPGKDDKEVAAAAFKTLAMTPTSRSKRPTTSSSSTTMRASATSAC